MTIEQLLDSIYEGWNIIETECYGTYLDLQGNYLPMYFSHETNDLDERGDLEYLGYYEEEGRTMNVWVGEVEETLPQL